MYYKQFFRGVQTSYKNRLVLIFSIVILIPALLVFIMGISYTFKQTEKSIEDKIMIADSDQRKSLDDTLNDINNKLSYLTRSEALKNILSVQSPLSLSEMLDIKTEINNIGTAFRDYPKFCVKSIQNLG